jgi:all-trans-8'-apo-beta-carotenal 15,15'-oxygenase
MTCALDRRQFILSTLASAAAAAIITPEMALAGAAPAGWSLAVADVEGDIAPRPLPLVDGKAPKDFSGTLFRNGPAKFRRGGGVSGHWFDGDGLIRRFHVDGGTASLAARFVDTPKRRLETKLDAIVVPGFGTKRGNGARLGGPDDANAANTSVIMAGGDLFALWEAGSATRIDPETLATLGVKTFRADLKAMPFSAHPRRDPDGTVWNFGGNGKQTALWKVKADGALDQMTLIDLPRRSYFHDFTMTARHIIIVLQPWLQEEFTFPLSTGMVWRPDHGTQVLVLDKNDLTKRRLFELPAFSFFHLGDGWVESDGTIRFDGCLEADPTFGQTSASALLRGEFVRSPRPVLTQIILRANGTAAMLSTKVEAEFPASDRRIAGFNRRFTSHVTGYRNTPFPHAIALWDWQRGHSVAHDFGDHQLVEEFLFVPRGEGEANGWLVGTTLNLNERATELHVLDASHIRSGPVATWRATGLPLPLGFHGTFRAG